MTKRTPACNHLLAIPCLQLVACNQPLWTVQLVSGRRPTPNSTRRVLVGKIDVSLLWMRDAETFRQNKNENWKLDDTFFFSCQNFVWSFIFPYWSLHQSLMPRECHYFLRFRCCHLRGFCFTQNLSSLIQPLEDDQRGGLFEGFNGEACSDPTSKI